MKNISGIDFHEVAVQRYWAPPATWTVEKHQAETKKRIYSSEWFGSRKMDGAFYKFTKDDDGNMELTGRSRSVGGDYLDKIEWVPQCGDFFRELPNGTCLLGELVFPNNEGSKNTTSITGCLKEKAIARQENGDKLIYYVFDCLAYNGVSFLNYTAAARVQQVREISEKYKSDYVRFAKYYEGEELWEQLCDILDKGGEGIVLLKKDGKYEPDKRPSKTTMKVKKELASSIDCFFTGRGTAPTRIYEGKELPNWKYWVNGTTDERLEIGEHYFDYVNGGNLVPVTKPYYYKWCGSLEIGLVNGDKVLPIGFLSGLTDEIKSDPSKYKGKVIEVSAMEIGYNDDGSFSGLRHAKMLGFREDKNWKECGFDQIK